MNVQYEATHMRDRSWVVRPAGALGTMGWTPVPWTAVFVKASTTAEALKKAAGVRNKTGQA